MSVFSFLGHKAAEGPASVDLSDVGKVIYPDSPEGRKFFRRRSIFIVLLAVVFVTINALSGAVVDFDFIAAVTDFPSAVVWTVTNFVPSAEALDKMPQILTSLVSTILSAVASSVVGGIFAYILAVLGSRSVGIGGPTSIIVRGIASLFRNIPAVAWSFLLLFSFNQSEFTGFLVLFLGSFGYLTRCFLETIDEISMGVIEALRATGASYLQIVVQAVIPLSITSVVSWLLYMVETNIRDATLVGILTGTGIGFVFNIYYKSFDYDIAAVIILCIVVVVIACEATSNYVRRQII
ncbi:MAG TPA: ABC transporter permease subunit [Eggerthellaceae bacterium]|nr:ABC transporter permease subunit [Eggerthellaceae bacterium]